MQRYDLTLTDCGNCACIGAPFNPSADAWLRCWWIAQGEYPWTDVDVYCIPWPGVPAFTTAALLAGFTLELV